MTMTEFAVLGAINLAPFVDDKSLRKDHWVTAEEIARAVHVKDNLEDERVFLQGMGTKEIGYILRRLAMNWPVRSEPMVEKRRVQGQNQWRMTQKGLSVSIA